MISPTQNQALARWDDLPETLREALCSDTNTDFLWETAANEHIPQEKIHTVARILGYVLFGFLHPEDMAKEIQDQLSIDPRIAKELADKLSTRIFTPIRQDIDKAFNPINKTEGTGPKIIQDVSVPAAAPKPAAPPVPPPAPKPVVTSMNVPDVAKRPIPTPPTAPKPATPAPLTPSSKASAPPTPGWSRASSEQPVVKLGQPVVPMPKPPASNMTFAPVAPTPIDRPSVVRPAVPAPMPPTKGLVGEFAKRGFAPETPAASAAQAKPAAAQAKPEPAPVLIHKDASLTPQQKIADFHFPISPETAMNQRSAAPPPLKPAVLELGKAGEITPKTGPTSTRFVHYTEYKSPAPENPVQPAPTAKRQITEITSSTPAASPMTPPSKPMPAAPPMPPRPPQAPSAPQQSAPAAPSPTTAAPKEKVIFKNYTENETSPSPAIPAVPPAPSAPSKPSAPPSPPPPPPAPPKK